MPTPTMMSPAQLHRLAGQSDMPILVDVRTDEDVAANPRILPGSIRRDVRTISVWGPGCAGRRVVVICQRGLELSQAAAAWLRHEGVDVESLEGGFEGWVALGGLLVPPREANGRTIRITRAQPKVDRIACSWLIRRFIDPSAVFLFVAPAEVDEVPGQYRATPFDIDGVFWSHRDERCTFDVMLDEFGVHSPPLDCLAWIVRGAGTARPDLAAEAPGLLAASLGLSCMYTDDLAQLEAGLALYDAFYRWSRDATDETHNWPAEHVAPGPAREKAS
jgi:rhodanese-related sulfurtransferase